MGKVLDEEVVVKEYSPEYGDKTVEHLINVAGVEHGFREWDNHFISKEFLKISDKEQFWIAVNSKDEVIGAMGLMESEFSENIAKKSFLEENGCRREGKFDGNSLLGNV